jgi:hypothetical protein
MELSISSYSAKYDITLQCFDHNKLHMSLHYLHHMYCFAGSTTKHPLMAQAMTLAQNSVKQSSQKSYRSSWNKWEIFLQGFQNGQILHAACQKHS